MPKSGEVQFVVGFSEDGSVRYDCMKPNRMMFENEVAPPAKLCMAVAHISFVSLQISKSIEMTLNYAFER